MLDEEAKKKYVTRILTAACQTGMYNKWKFFSEHFNYYQNNCNDTWVHDIGDDRLKVTPQVRSACWAYLRNEYGLGRIKGGYIGAYFIINPGFRENFQGLTEQQLLAKTKKRESIGVPTRVQKRYIKEMMSPESIYWNSIIKYNPPIEIEFKGEKVVVNSPEFVYNHGFVFYNPYEVDGASLVAFLGQLRYIAEAPVYIKNYFHLRMRGMSIPHASILCQAQENIKECSCVPRMAPDGHTAFLVNRLSYNEYCRFLLDGVKPPEPQPFTERPSHAGWSNKLLPNQIGVEFNKQLQQTFETLPVETKLKFGKPGNIPNGFGACKPVFENMSSVELNKYKGPFVFTDYPAFLLDFVENKRYLKGVPDDVVKRLHDAA